MPVSLRYGATLNKKFAAGRSRTDTGFLPPDLKSGAYTSFATAASFLFMLAIPAKSKIVCFLPTPAKNSEATAGIAPANGGFADRSVSYFTTWPKCGRERTLLIHHYTVRAAYINRSITSSMEPGVRKPDALACPPPPKWRAIKETFTGPSEEERRLPFMNWGFS